MVTSPSISQLCVMLAVLLLGGAVFAEDAASRRPGLYDGTVGVQRDEIFEKSLKGRNTETMEYAPLKDIFVQVEQITGMQVWIDNEVINIIGNRFEAIMTEHHSWFQGETVTQLGHRLSRLLRDTPLVWIVHNGVLTLTTEEKSQRQFVTRQYPIGDLLSDQCDATTIMFLLEQSTTGPWSSDEPGTGTLSMVGNQLFVRQTHRNQQAVAEILTGLRRNEPVVVMNCTDEDLRLRRMLEQRRISLDFPDITLKKVVECIQVETDARIRIDTQALVNSGLDEETRVVARAVNLPLIVALQTILGDVNGTELTVIVANEECLITTAEAANEMYETVLYRVGPLGMTGEKLNEFVAMLEQETSGPWDADEPGTGTICGIAPRSLLAVRQVQRVHREILEILRDLRPKSAATPVAQTAASQITSAIQSHSNPMSPKASVALVKTPTFRLPRIPNLFAAVTWEVVWDYAPLLMALLVGGVAGYIGRH